MDVSFDPPRDLRSYFTDDFDSDPSTPVKVCCYWHSEGVPSLAIYRDHAYCFGQCRRWVSYYDMVQMVEEGHQPQLVQSTRSRVAKPISDDDLCELADIYHRRLYTLGKQDYFLARGITEEIIKHAHLGHTYASYAIPVYTQTIDYGTCTWETQLQTIRFRRDDVIDPSLGKKYWGLKGRNETYIYAPYPLERTVVWCEGELDTLLALSLGFSALTLTNGVGAIDTKKPETLDPVAQLLDASNVKEVRLAWDNDRASYQRSLQLTGFLRGALGLAVKLCRFRTKDITELYQTKGKDATIEALGGIPCL